MDVSPLADAIVNVAGFKATVLSMLGPSDVYSLRFALGVVVELTEQEKLKYCSLYAYLGISTDWVMDMNRLGYVVALVGGCLDDLTYSMMNGGKPNPEDAMRRRHVVMMCFLKTPTAHSDPRSRRSRHQGAFPEAFDGNHYPMPGEGRGRINVAMISPGITYAIVNEPVSEGLDKVEVNISLLCAADDRVPHVYLHESVTESLTESSRAFRSWTKWTTTCMSRCRYIWTDLFAAKPDAGRLRWTTSWYTPMFMTPGKRPGLAPAEAAIEHEDKIPFVFMDTGPSGPHMTYAHYSTRLMLWDPSTSIFQAGNKVYSTQADWARGKWKMIASL